MATGGQADFEAIVVATIADGIKVIEVEPEQGIMPEHVHTLIIHAISTIEIRIKIEMQ